MFDVCIIGAGVVGSAIARELSKYNTSICLIEKNEDVSTETTKANSGIVHGGYAAKHGSLKAKFCCAGNRMYAKLNDELHFGYAEVGSFVIGFNDEDKVIIESLYDNGIKNGVEGLEIVDADFVKEKEPYLNQDINVALYCSTAGITSPYEFAIALAENAVENGVDLKLNTEVVKIDLMNDHFNVHVKHYAQHITDETIQAKKVINAAGLYSDAVAKMVGLSDFKITPRQGQYLLFDRDQGYLVNSVIFQVPTSISKGILVTRTYHGNLLIGPDANDVSEKENVATTKESLDYVKETARKSLPDFDLRKVITSFAGNRASSDKGDFIIEETRVKGFINVAGIESPGLTAAPAIAEYVRDLVEQSGLTLKKKDDFNPNRKPYKVIADMDEASVNALIQQEPAYGRIICRCETISEGEILDALRRPIPISSMDAIKRRTRAGMGRCQAGFCTPKILEIMFDELNTSVEAIEKKTRGSELVVGRTKRSLQKKVVNKNEKI